MGRMLPSPNRDMMFYEERERMRKLLNKIPPPPPIRHTNYGVSGTSGEMGTSGYDGNLLSGSTLNPNLYTMSGTTQSFGSTEVKSKKLIPNIQPIESEREKVKASWKFWKK